MTRRRSRHIDAVLADERIPSATIDDPDDVDALAMAIEMRAARPGAGQPSESFITDLRRRLAEEQGGAVERNRVTRRTALAGVAGALAGAAAAAVGFETLSGSTEHLPEPVLDLADGRWTSIATVAELTSDHVRPFSTSAVSGFVSLQADGAPVAVNGACTHQGCLLRLNALEGRLDCPCHRTAFAPDGTLLFHQPPSAPAPLTRLRVRRTNDTIEALLPGTAD